MDVLLGRVNRHIVNIKDVRGEVPSIDRISNVNIKLLVGEVQTSTVCSLTALPNNNGFEIEWLAGDKASWGEDAEIHLQVSLVLDGYNLKKTYYAGKTKDVGVIPEEPPPVENYSDGFISWTLNREQEATSYVTEEEATQLSKGIIYGEELRAIENDALRQLLMNATTLLDATYAFKGEKRENGALQNPRKGTERVIRQIKVATTATAISMAIDESVKLEKVGELTTQHNDRIKQLRAIVEGVLKPMLLEKAQEKGRKIQAVKVM